jgi:hypothetical protein
MAALKTYEYDRNFGGIGASITVQGETPEHALTTLLTQLPDQIETEVNGITYTIYFYLNDLTADVLEEIA